MDKLLFKALCLVLKNQRQMLRALGQLREVPDAMKEDLRNSVDETRVALNAYEKDGWA